MAYGPQPDPTAVTGRRILAWILDLAIFVGVIVGLYASQAEYIEVGPGVTSDYCDRLEDVFPDEVSSCIAFADRVVFLPPAASGFQTAWTFGYFGAFVLLQGLVGASPGKLLTGLRVVDADGRRAGVGRSLVRTLLWAVDGAPWIVPLVGPIVGLTSRGHRRVGDMVAGTYVIGSSDVGRPVLVDAAAPPPGQQAWGTAPPPPPSMMPGPTTPDPDGGETDTDGPRYAPSHWETPTPQPTPPVAPPPGSVRPSGDGAPPPVTEPVTGPITEPVAEAAEPPSQVAEPVDIAATDPAVDDYDPTGGFDPSIGGDITAPEEWFQTPSLDVTAPAGSVVPGSGEQPLPPPQWDAARGTYVQWDPNAERWTQWDGEAEAWVPLDSGG